MLFILPVGCFPSGPWAIAEKAKSRIARLLGVSKERVTQAALKNALVNLGIHDSYMAQYRVRVGNS